MEDYEMLTRLGGGSFADVYKAREKSTGDIVAIKVLKKNRYGYSSIYSNSMFIGTYLLSLRQKEIEE